MMPDSPATLQGALGYACNLFGEGGAMQDAGYTLPRTLDFHALG
jgi:hypothetical protein